MIKSIQMGSHQVHVLPAVTELAGHAAKFIAEYCAGLAGQQNSISLALSGGSTPVLIYQKLLNSPFVDIMPWRAMHFYFGDERYVPHDHQQSNYKMACEAFLNAAPIQPDQIKAIPTDCEDINDCAGQYAQLMQTNLSDALQMDFVLLGMGDDGHTASLFPGTPILSEMDKPVAAVYVEKFQSWRISMTYPVLNRARSVCVLVSGEAKARVLSEVLTNPQAGYPIQGINNPAGITWLVDEAAAKYLMD